MKNLFAIIGPTASGKSDLAIKLAQKLDSVILSVDSLSIYKEIDIASAKPTKEEMSNIKHFGIDILYPNESFDVVKFIKLYNEAKSWAKEHNKGLIVVGGTSFYIKVLKDGISPMPKISKEIEQKVAKEILDIDSAYQKLLKIDKEYAKSITKKDNYRISKALSIYYATNQKPSDYFKANKPKPIELNLKIYEIAINREELRTKITKRTKKMIEVGLIDEVAYLEKKYTKKPNCMKAIGIKEVLDYFDGVYNLQELEAKIITNTARLAKRQVTFNKTQLKVDFRGSVKEIFSLCLK